MEIINQRLLFNDCSTTCEGYAACGGYKHTAPCGCIWPIESKKRYKCHKCYIICTEKTDNYGNLVFAKEIEYGHSLDQVHIVQPELKLLPFIPSSTSNKYCETLSFSNSVAVDVRTLFNCRRKKAAALNPKFISEAAVRKYLHVTPECQLIAVLNAPDWMLESFWGMPRNEVFYQLAALGFTICTAPTFSITALTTAGTLAPYSHHIAMHLRHNKVLAEIENAGLIAIPNLYWLDNDKKEMQKWINWLLENDKITCVSRDFTSTRDWHTVEAKILELIWVLSKVGRKFHILIIGTGPKKTSKLLSLFKTAGHSVSIITADPIHQAIHGKKYIVDDDGLLTSISSDQEEYSLSSLVKHNLSLFEKNIEDAQCLTTTYTTSSYYPPATPQPAPVNNLQLQISFQ